MAARHILSSLLFAASLTGAQAQLTSSYKDPTTGITFQRITQDAGYSFGIAVPEEPSTDFIGQISATMTAGWAGVSLTGQMVNSLLVAAWPNGEDIVSSLRTTTGYSNPSVFSDATLKPISTGTSVNSTGFTYTFLCSGCIGTPSTTASFNASSDSVVFGWALSTDEVTTPSSASSALNYHSKGFGGFGVDLASAKKAGADYATWAALASSGNSTTPSTGNSTTPTNGTAPATGYNGTVSTSNSTYDYIVVGGGAAGIVTAQRLVETGKTVLLIERGKASYYFTGGDLLVSWNDTTTPYEVPGVFNALSSWPGNDAYCSDTAQMAGCILGGGTTINGMAFIKPPAHDFDDNWPETWKWSDVEASAARLYERNPGTTQPSMDGKMYDNAVYDVLSKVFEGAGWKGVSTNEEPNEKYKIYSPSAINVADGRRAGPVHAYLPLALGKSNFKLQLNTKVIRAVRTNSTVTGVEVELEDKTRQFINIKQGGKVILAAGAMSSPRILFNSGIGPAEQIQTVKSGSTGVTLPEESAWIESPIGFVRDHSFLYLQFNVTAGMEVKSTAEYKTPCQEDIDLFDQGSGPLTESFLRLNTFTEVTTSDNTTVSIQTHNYATENNTITMLVFTTHGSTSSGKLTITADGNTVFSESPYLQTDTDKEAMAMAIDEMLALAQASNGTIKYAGSANDTGAAIVKRSTPNPGIHMTGTTIMGTDKTKAVVDTNCQVYGTDNLFVVDAGMHADLPTGNTHVIVMVAAEHAVQKIIALDGSGAGNGSATVSVTPAASTVVTGTILDVVTATAVVTSIIDVQPSASAPAPAISNKASASSKIHTRPGSPSKHTHTPRPHKSSSSKAGSAPKATSGAAAPSVTAGAGNGFGSGYSAVIPSEVAAPTVTLATSVVVAAPSAAPSGNGTDLADRKFTLPEFIAFLESYE